MLRAAVLGALLASLAFAPAADAQLPLREDRGVRLVERSGTFVLVFTERSGKLRRRINSTYAEIEFVKLGDPFTNVSGGNLDVPPRGRRVSTGFRARDADFCRVFLRGHTARRADGGRKRVPRRILFSIPITQAGAVYLDEESKARTMLAVTTVAELLKPRGSDKALTYAQLIDEVPRLAKRVVALAAPADTPAPRRVGYYSDGAEHTVVAMLSASGRRLFIEQAADDVFSTNVGRYIFGDQL